MWPGPQGQLGSRNYLLSSLDDSLRRLSIDYVDIFYSHRFDPVTPLDETVGALASAVQSGKARYVGISSYSAKHTAEAKAIADRAGISVVIHQPSYNLLNRWIESASQTSFARPAWVRSRSRPWRRACSPTGTRPKMPPTSTGPPTAPPFPHRPLTEDVLAKIRGLKAIADARGQSLAQMALAWVLRDPVVASTLIGASSVAQLDENLGALDNLDFSSAELSSIDEYATEAGIDLWRSSSDL